MTAAEVEVTHGLCYDTCELSGKNVINLTALAGGISC